MILLYLQRIKRLVNFQLSIPKWPFCWWIWHLSLTGFLSGFTACTCCFHDCLQHEWNPVSFFRDGYCGKEHQGTSTRQLINWIRKDHISCYFANHLQPTLKLRESIRFWKVCLPWYSPDDRLSEMKRKFKATWVLDGFDAVSIE